MIERMADVPAGVIGLRASGKLTRDDYRDVLEPALKEATDSGEARVLFVLPDFDRLEPRAWIEDVKTGLGVEIGHRSVWKRLAVVTGVEWIAKAMHLFAWAMPGELAVYEMDELEKAKAWVAA
jgi:stage II sporulation SpoAA-like protein